MKRQLYLIFSLFVAILIAIFAVINVNPVKVNFLFTTANWPLIIVILLSVLTGAILMGSISMVRNFRLKGEVKRLRAIVEKKEKEASFLEDDAK